MSEVGVQPERLVGADGVVTYRYWRTSTGTLHTHRACHSAARSRELTSTDVELDPWMLWETAWQNHELKKAGHIRGVSVYDGDEGQVGITVWCCLHCVEQAAIDLGWVNTHEPDPERRHR